MLATPAHFGKHSDAGDSIMTDANDVREQQCRAVDEILASRQFKLPLVGMIEREQCAHLGSGGAPRGPGRGDGSG